MTLSSGGKQLVGVALSPDGRWLAAGCFDGTVRLWDLTTQTERMLSGHNSLVVLLGFSPDGHRLVTASFDHTAKVWEIPSGQLLFTLNGHSDWVYGAVFNPDGKTIATGSRDGTVRLWNAGDGGSLRTVWEYGDAVMCVAFSPDEQRVLTASVDHTARIWEVETGRCLRVLAGHTNAVLQGVWSPDGQSIATGSLDHTARLWNAETGTLLFPPLQGHDEGVNSLAFSPDGQRLATVGGGIHTYPVIPSEWFVILWDAATGQNLLRLAAHVNVVRAVCFSPDGTRLVTGSQDHTALVRSAFPWRSADYPGEATQPLEERIAQYKAQYWLQVPGASNRSPPAGSRATSHTERRIDLRQTGEYSVANHRGTKTQPLRPIPARDRVTGSDQIDLTAVYWVTNGSSMTALLPTPPTAV